MMNTESSSESNTPPPSSSSFVVSNLKYSFSDYVKLCNHMAQDEKSTVDITPDSIWRQLGLLTQSPDIITISNRNPVNHPFLVASPSNQISWSQDIISRNHLSDLSNQYHSINWYRNLSGTEQQVRVNIQSGLTSNVESGRQVYNNAATGQLFRFRPIFNGYTYTSEFTTYSLISLYHSSIESPIAPPANAAAFHYIGIETLAQLRLNDPNLYGDYYLLLWDHYAPTDADDFQWFIQYSSDLLGQQLLLVLTDPDTAFPGANSQAPFTLVAAPGAFPLAHPLFGFFQRIFKLVGPEDLKMMATLPGVLTFSDMGGNDQSLSTYMPRYNFYNHLLDWLSRQVYIANYLFDPAAFSHQWLRNWRSYVAFLFATRVTHYYPYSTTMAVQPTIQSLFNQSILHWPGQWLNQGWTLKFLASFELLAGILACDLIAKPVDLSDGKFKNLTFTITGNNLRLREFETENGIPKWPPAFLSASDYPAAALPSFNIAVPVNRSGSLTMHVATGFFLRPSLYHPTSLQCSGAPPSANLLSPRNWITISTNPAVPLLSNTLVSQHYIPISHDDLFQGGDESLV